MSDGFTPQQVQKLNRNFRVAILGQTQQTQREIVIGISDVQQSLFDEANERRTGIAAVTDAVEDEAIARADADEDLANAISTLNTTLRNLITTTVRSLYPVGTVYINSSNTANPSTYLGFGTWTRVTITNDPPWSDMYVWKRTA